MSAEVAGRLERSLAALPLVAILRGIRPAEAVEAGRHLVETGWRVIEVPLNSPQALESIALLASAFPQAVIGAGTVLSAAQVRAVHAAGGQCVIAPNFDADVLQEAARLRLPCMPGVATPSEAFAALQAGAFALKLFPAEMIPPAAVGALRSVLPPGTRLFPVGGIDVANAGAYRAKGADGFGIGSNLYRAGMPLQQLRRNAQRWAESLNGWIAAA